jgi:hypothetical protein
VPTAHALDRRGEQITPGDDGPPEATVLRDDAHVEQDPGDEHELDRAERQQDRPPDESRQVEVAHGFLDRHRLPHIQTFSNTTDAAGGRDPTRRLDAIGSVTNGPVNRTAIAGARYAGVRHARRARAEWWR